MVLAVTQAFMYRSTNSPIFASIHPSIQCDRYLVSPEAQAQLDDEEARMREGRDWPTVDAFFDEVRDDDTDKA